MPEYKKDVDAFIKNPFGIEFQEKLKSAEFTFQTEKCYKDAEKSKKLRAHGNIEYGNKSIFESIKLYSERIAYGPFYTDALAKAFGNRSAALVEGGLYKECIEDIYKAYEHGYPKTEEKLLLRLAFCQYMLYEDANLNKTIQEIISVSKTHTNKGEIIKYLKTKPRNDKLFAYFYRNPPPISYGSSSEIPCASNAIKIAYDNTNGQHLVATSDINIGDVLIVEKPYAIFLLESQRYFHCSHCMKFLLSLIPCGNCAWTMYCSVKCKSEAANEYHEMECIVGSRISEEFKFLDDIIEISTKKPCFAIIRCLCKVGAKYIQNQIDKMRSTNSKKIRKSRTDGFINGIFDPENFETILNLPNKLRNDTGTPFFDIILCSVIEKCFNTDKQFDSIEFTAFCLKLFDSLRVNSFGTRERVLKNYKQEVTGGMICSIFPLATPSCYANCTSMMYSNMKVTVCCLPIKKGSQITRFADSFGTDKPYNPFNTNNSCHCEACIKKINLNDFERPSNMPIITKLLVLHFNSMQKRILDNSTIAPTPNEEEFTEQVNSLIAKHTDFINNFHGTYNFDSVFLQGYFNLMSCLYLRSNLTLFKY